MLLFELTVRGIGNYTTLDEMWNWFALAHEWVVRGFTDLIDPQMQKMFGGSEDDTRDPASLL